MADPKKPARPETGKGKTAAPPPAVTPPAPHPAAPAAPHPTAAPAAARAPVAPPHAPAAGGPAPMVASGGPASANLAAEQAAKDKDSQYINSMLGHKQKSVYSFEILTIPFLIILVAVDRIVFWWMRPSLVS